MEKTKKSYFSRYNKWLVPLFGYNYEPKVLYLMFDYLKLDPKNNSREIVKMFKEGIIWNHMIITQETIKRLYPIFEEEVEKDEIIKKGFKECRIINKKVILTENQLKKLISNLNEKF